MTAANWQKLETGCTTGCRREHVVGIAARANGWTFFIVGLLVVMVSGTCPAQNIVLIHTARTASAEQKQIQEIADMYNLKVDSVEVDPRAATSVTTARLSQSGTLGVLISYDALAALDRKKVLATLRRPGRTPIPILIFGILANDHPSQLKLWSGGMIHDCTAPAKDFKPGALKVADTPALVHSLAGVLLPAVTTPVCTLQFETTTGAETVLAAQENGSSSAVLVRARSETDEILFAPQMELFDTSWAGKPAALPQAFSSLAPFLLFLKYAAGDYGWHLDGHYANLTIDDPWLIEPYGHLHYKALLEEMEKHNFHTTIAFIPWNYDRSKANVVDLLVSHPERYSVCIHGNNHTHREFGGYGDAPLKEQTANLRQAVARMEKFRELTGISYDRFMIFPHAVAPESTFAALRASDFLGTANSQNVPAGSSMPANPIFLLRPYTLDYANFLSMFRYSAEGPISRMEIAIQSFLGNPLLFYGHEKLFDNGIGGFNKTADLVNQIQPDTQWKSLGEIARHLYLVRRREDGELDVRMLSNEMALRNPTQRDTVFHVELEGDGSAAMPSLSIDDSPAVLEGSGSILRFRLTVPAGQVRRVRLHYQNAGVTAADLGKASLYASALRYASDFRDLYLSRFSLGRVVTRAYYDHAWDSFELRVEMAWRIVAAGLIVALASIWCFRQRTAAKELAATRRRNAGDACSGARAGGKMAGRSSSVEE